MFRTLVGYIAIFQFLVLAGCAAAPRQELEAARNAVARAYASGAPTYAQNQYQDASAALRDSEHLVHRGSYAEARRLLPRAEELARNATEAAIAEQLRLERERQQEARLQERLRAQTPPPVEKVEPPPPKPAPPTPPKPEPVEPPPPLTSYAVGEGENLWTISARPEIYGEAMLWPLLYRANRDQIKDPRQIYPGQVLGIPRCVPKEELDEARAAAKESDVFPVDSLMKKQP